MCQEYNIIEASYFLCLCVKGSRAKMIKYMHHLQGKTCLCVLRNTIYKVRIKFNLYTGPSTSMTSPLSTRYIEKVKIGYTWSQDSPIYCSWCTYSGTAHVALYGTVGPLTADIAKCCLHKFLIENNPFVVVTGFSQCIQLPHVQHGFELNWILFLYITQPYSENHCIMSTVAL